jgi:ribose/xylose/arabinose/galactoside ABC-type transport system permease subunit
VLLSSISHVVNLLGASAWYQQLLKGAIILLSAAAISVGGRWRVNQHRPRGRMTKR